MFDIPAISSTRTASAAALPCLPQGEKPASLHYALMNKGKCHMLTRVPALTVNRRDLTGNPVLLLILFVRALTYLETRLFLLSMFHNGTFLIIWNINLYGKNVRVCVIIYLSRNIMVGATSFIEINIMSKLYKFPCFAFCLYVFYFVSFFGSCLFHTGIVFFRVNTKNK
jgi:hypothetical protein